MSRNRVVGSIIRNPWIFTTKSLGTAKRSNEKDRWDMSFSNIFPGIITVWMQAWLKHLTLLIAWFVLHRSFCCAPLLYGTRIMLQSGPVVFFFFFFFFFCCTVFISLSGRDAIMAYWYNIWQLVPFVYISIRRLNQAFFIPFFFFSIYSKVYSKFERQCF